MSESPAHTIPCPHCGAALQLPAAAAGHPVVCPHCFNSFYLALPSSDPIPTPLPPSQAEGLSPPPSPPGEEGLPDLDADRIHQFASLRRSLYRYRSYGIIAVVLCLGGIAQIGLYIIQDCREHDRRHAYAWAIVIPFLFYGVIYFTRLAFRFHVQAHQSLMKDDPTLPPPDFSKLSDGSQIYKNLENVRDDLKR